MSRKSLATKSPPFVAKLTISRKRRSLSTIGRSRKIS